MTLTHSLKRVSCTSCNVVPLKFFHKQQAAFLPDIQRLLKEEKASSSDEGWKSLKKNDLCETWKKNEPDKPVNLVKVSTIDIMYHKTTLV